MIKLFKPEDFNTSVPLIKYAHLAADRANALFAKWVEEQTVVWGAEGQWRQRQANPNERYDEYTARLILVEKIEKKCEHIPIIHTAIKYSEQSYSAVCKICGAPMKPTDWQGVES